VPSFFELTNPRQIGPRSFVLDVPDGYQQGRGAFGGLVLASLARAIGVVVDDPVRTLRTLTAELCGPVLPGEAAIEVEPLRLGSGTSTLAARLVQNDEVQAHAVAVFGRARSPEPRYDGVATPTMPAWRGCQPLPTSNTTAAFARAFEYRLDLRAGAAPFAGGGEARTAGWVRAREPGDVRDAAFIVGMADAFWPALLMALPAPRPMATITFTIDVVGSCEGLDPEAPLYHQSHTLVARDGFAPELRTLWGEDGRLLAINHQTFVVIK
jgi:acyl-CoA thioesterase